MRANKYDAGTYRLSWVSKDTSFSRKYTSWKKAYGAYMDALRTGEVLYAVIVDQGDRDPAYWTVRDEFHHTLKPRP